MTTETTQTERLFRGPQVCRITGVTYRQLDYWARTGILEPLIPARGSGSQRLYAEWQLLAAKVVDAVSNSGYSRVHSARNVVPAIQARWERCDGDMTGQRLGIKALGKAVMIVVNLEELANEISVCEAAA